MIAQKVYLYFIVYVLYSCILQKFIVRKIDQISYYI